MTTRLRYRRDQGLARLRAAVAAVTLALSGLAGAVIGGMSR